MKHSFTKRFFSGHEGPFSGFEFVLYFSAFIGCAFARNVGDLFDLKTSAVKWQIIFACRSFIDLCIWRAMSMGSQLSAAPFH